MAVAETRLVPASYVQPSAPETTASDLPELGAQLLTLANAARHDLSLAPLSGHEGLAAVAEAHARDMAERGYLGYTDASGASLFDQVRIADRTALIGSFGSAIAVLDAGATAAEIHAAIQSDAANAENLRRSFGHAGVGTHVSGGRLYVVQLFARLDGEFDSPLPMTLASGTRLKPASLSEGMTPVSWSLTGKNGELIERGSGRRIERSGAGEVEGYLNLDVAMGTGIYTLRGPYVRVN